jgi:hypothetical protein
MQNLYGGAGPSMTTDLNETGVNGSFYMDHNQSTYQQQQPSRISYEQK